MIEPLPKPALNERKRVRLVVNVTGLLLAAVLARLILWRLFDVSLPDLLSIWGLASVGFLGAFTGILPRVTRARLLLGLQNTLSSRNASYAVIFALAATGIGSGFSRYQIRWVGPNQISLTINGRPHVLQEMQNESGTHIANRFAFSYLKYHIEIKLFSFTGYPRPLTKNVINIPLFVTTHEDHQSEEIEKSLLGAFFQFFEQERIEESQRIIDATQVSSSADKNKLQRFKHIYEILEKIFVKPDTLIAIARIGSFSENYPDDPWIVLLKSSAAYAEKNYELCVSILDDKYIASVGSSKDAHISLTARFFKGACKLKQASKALDLQRVNLLESARRDFSVSEQQTSQIDRDNFFNLALPSSVIFQGICLFQAGNSTKAIETFSRSFDIGLLKLRARAYNAAGFARLVEGNLGGAADYLRQSMEVYPEFPYARSNYGFVLMANPKKLDEARSYFLANVQDTTLQKSSQRDVLLARLSLIHLSDLQGMPLREVNNEYSDLSRQIGGNSWNETNSENIKYGYLARELADRIYLNGQYFALEIFALNFLCKARERIAPLSKSNDSDAVNLRVNLDIRIENLRKRVSPVWLSTPKAGWFVSLNGC
jgi:tetratricopeptide (TPR) repeat protein